MDNSSVGALGGQPAGEARHRRQRHEGIEAGQLALQVLDHLLDQEVAERDAAQPFLAVGDRVEHGGGRLIRRDRFAVLRQQRADGGRDFLRQRYLDEDQRLIQKLWMEEGEAAAVGRLQPPAEVVPVPDRVDRLVADDLLQDIGGRRPVDPAQHQETPVEPG